MRLLCSLAAGFLGMMGAIGIVAFARSAETVERWGRYEVTLTQAKSYGNPFTQVWLKSHFKSGANTITVNGFYDGEQKWKVRFMPTREGKWNYRTESNDPELNGRSGAFVCGPPGKGNHGPVRVRNNYQLEYADGTPHFSIGTTCYAWAHQGDELEEQTLATLRKAPFNKMRMCIFPKDYAYNKNEPQYYPFEGTPLKKWDYARFNPKFFRHFEKRVGDLLDLGIEADIILFHPYDRWGFADMTPEADDRYLRYVVARLAAYRNVWWSMANEYDFMRSKKESDWDRFFKIVQESDPYNHPRGIHNGRRWYDHTKPWVTHASLQTTNFRGAKEYREKYKKPIVYDECRYEGNIPQGWGNITARQMVRNFWMGSLAGCYVGHGETYKHPKDILWWSKGGVLHGQSPARIAFLKKIMEQAPFAEMTPNFELSPGNYVLAKPGEYYLIYFTGSAMTTFNLPGSRPHKVDGIDTWDMTITSLGSASPGKFSFAPPKADYVVRLSLYGPGEKMRPDAKASAKPMEGIVPLRVQFSTPSRLRCSWTFGDGTVSSKTNPVHVYRNPGLYTATLTVTDERGASACTILPIAADRDSGSPIVRVGFKDGDRPDVTLHGKIIRGSDGSYNLGDGEPWKWISVGDKPVEALEGLRSFTILGWVNPTSLKIGSGGNRIAFNLNYNRSGFDLVCLRDGRLRLAVNEWPDGVRNDSSSSKIRVGQWRFFAVTYDGTKAENNVRWYFGDADTPAELDRATSYSRGPTGKGSGTLTIGNYNETIHRHGVDRQFRGRLRGIEIFGSRIGPGGALSLNAVRNRQRGD